jgi:hypothetical protein
MTLTEIEAECYRQLGFASSPAADVTTRIRANINLIHRRVLRKKSMSQFRQALLPMTTVASSPFAVLPQSAVEILNIAYRASDRNLVEVSLAEIRSYDPGVDSTSSDPTHFAVVNYSSPVARQPADASQLLVDSDSASDTSTAYIECIRTGGYYRATSAQMTGTTAVNLGPSDTIEVRKFYMAAVAVGTVTLVEDSEGGTELARIPIGRNKPRYTMLHLYPYPSDALTLYVDCELHIEDLANANDEPLFHEDYHEILVSGALEKEYIKREKPALAKEHRVAMATGIAELQLWVHRNPGAWREMNGPRWSQLGPYFPVGS